MAETDFDNENPPGTASAGDVVYEAATANDDNVSSPNSGEVDTTEQTDTQNTNAEPSTPNIPDRLPFIPKLPNANNPFQNFARNALGGVLGAGGSAISAASVTQSRVERNTQSFVYRTVQVTSRFSQGRFTQQLEGVILNFDDFVSRSNVNTNQVQDLDSQNVDDGSYDQVENARFARQGSSVNNQSSSTAANTESAVQQDQGGTGPAQNSSTTTADGQDISIREDTSNDSEVSSPEAAQVIARDD